MRMMRQLLAVIVLTAALTGAWSSTALARSVALVVGNADYANVDRLATPGDDAAGMAAALRRLGFEVTLLGDADYGALRRAITDFERAAASADAAVFYFSGHGVRIDGQTWLIPADARLATHDVVPLETISVELPVAAVSGAGRLGLVILDASRVNPFLQTMVILDGRTERVLPGPAPIDPGRGVVWTAAPAGALDASDGGRFSLFTEAVLEHLETPGQTLDALFDRIEASVVERALQFQRPLAYVASGAGGAYLLPPSGGVEPAPEAASQETPQEVPQDVPDERAQGGGQEGEQAAGWPPLNAPPGGPSAEGASEDAAGPSGAPSNTPPSSAALGPVPEGVDQKTQDWWERALAGDPDGIVAIGYRYRRGLGGLPQSDAEAVRLYRIAADMGHPYGQANLGFMYDKGLGGLPEDDVEAVRLYRLAADQGDAGGQANLAAMYLGGYGGLEKDEVEALRLYRLAAAQRDVGAYIGLGHMYERGLGGLEPSREEAIRYYRLAAEQGDAWAKDALKRLGVEE